MNNDNLKKQLLMEELELLNRSMQTLKLSMDKCSNIIGKQEYSFEEMESFDSLTSKFSRTSDLYAQKILRTVWMLLHEPFVPFIDMANKANKMNIIESADQLIEIRDLRNQITHEYLPDAITKLVPDVLTTSTLLLKNIYSTIAFIDSRTWTTNN